MPPGTYNPTRSSGKTDCPKSADGDDCNFLFFGNTTTHEPTLLSEPDYVPALEIDNTEFDEAHADRYQLNGEVLRVNDPVDEEQGILAMEHYHINMATLLRIGEWLDYLRDNDVYDNTRIIIVSDHGRELRLHDYFVYREGDNGRIIFDVDGYFPLMMFKDFDSTGFTTDHSFMTNADAPLLIMDGVIDKMVNPFTGRELNNDEKFAHPQYITKSRVNMPSKNNGYTFVPSEWASVHDDLWDRDNWQFFNDETLFPE